MHCNDPAAAKAAQGARDSCKVTVACLAHFIMLGSNTLMLQITANLFTAHLIYLHFLWILSFPPPLQHSS